MPPGTGFPVPPFEWPHVGRQWPPYNVESGQADGLVGWWPPLASQGTLLLRDLSGRAHHGTPIGSPVWSYDPALGWVLQYDGSSDYVNTSNLALPSSNTITIVGWIKPLGVISNYAGLVFDLDNWSGVNYAGASNNLGYHWNDDYYGWDSGLTPMLGQWSFFALAVQAARATMYHGKAGVLTSATSTGAHALVSLATISIGRLGAGQLFEGRIGDSRIYNRTLTAAEVGQLYNPATRWELYQLPRRLWRLVPVAAGATYYQSVGGVLTFVGGIGKKTSKGLSGTLTPTGGLVKKTSKGLGGTLTPTGSIRKKTSRVLGGTLTPTGSITRKTSKGLEGAVTFAGGLVKRTSKVLGGTLTPTGSIRKKTSKGLEGALTFAGSIVKKTSVSVSGALTFAGSLDTSATFKRALSGTITFIGTLSTALAARQALSGAISFVGGLATQYTAGPGGAWIRWIDHRLLKWRKKFQ